jgi:hypothetical protein
MLRSSVPFEPYTQTCLAWLSATYSIPPGSRARSLGISISDSPIVPMGAPWAS